MVRNWPEGDLLIRQSELCFAGTQAPSHCLESTQCCVLLTTPPCGCPRLCSARSSSGMWAARAFANWQEEGDMCIVIGSYSFCSEVVHFPAPHTALAKADHTATASFPGTRRRSPAALEKHQGVAPRWSDLVSLSHFLVACFRFCPSLLQSRLPGGQARAALRAVLPGSGQQVSSGDVPCVRDRHAPWNGSPPQVPALRMGSWRV